MIALPDLSSWAMENWGLITYREANLLYDANDFSTANKKEVATSVSHELAHQVDPLFAKQKKKERTPLMLGVNETMYFVEIRRFHVDSNTYQLKSK